MMMMMMMPPALATASAEVANMDSTSTIPR